MQWANDTMIRLLIWQKLQQQFTSAKIADGKNANGQGAVQIAANSILSSKKEFAQLRKRKA